MIKLTELFRLNVDDAQDRAFAIQRFSAIIATVFMVGLVLFDSKDRFSRAMLGISFASLALAAVYGQRSAGHSRNMVKHAQAMVDTANDAMEKFRELRDEGAKLRAEAQHISEQATIKLNEADATLAEAKRIREGRS